jgi:hypothetical protein
MADDWTDQVHQVLLAWLLEPENPSVRVLTLTELLDRDPEDQEVLQARQMIAECAEVESLLADQHPDGYWSKPERYFERHTGTAWRWLLLHELGFDRAHPQMLKAADFLLDVAFNDAAGAFSSHPDGNPVPCYNGWLLWGLYRSDYGDDPRVRSALQWVIETTRFSDGDAQVADPDNGCWGRHVCVRGVIPLLRALAELPEAYRSEEVRRLLDAGVEFILAHHVYKRSHDLSMPLNAKMTQLTFPGFYWPDFVEVLLLLTHLGCRDPRMKEAVAYLQRKQRKDGTWKLQRTYNERSKHDTFPVIVPTGARGEASKWVTLRSLIVLKRWFGE